MFEPGYVRTREFYEEHGCVVWFGPTVEKQMSSEIGTAEIQPMAHGKESGDVFLKVVLGFFLRYRSSLHQVRLAQWHHDTTKKTIFRLKYARSSVRVR